MSMIEDFPMEIEASSPRSCDHRIVRYGFCTACALELEVDQRQYRSFDYLFDGLQLSHKAVSLNKRLETRSSCLKEKKLHLVLDLDHTLLHTVSVPCLSEAEKYLAEETSSRDDLWTLNLDYLTKLRPFLREFLEEASELFRLYVYTMGNRAYAKAVLKVIDPKEVYFGNRVITRDESPHLKTLDMVLAEERAVLIVDDTPSVWTDHKSNLLPISEYNYFSFDGPLGSKSYSVDKTDESESEGGLACILTLLKEVHYEFFRFEQELEYKDVRSVLQDIEFHRIDESW